MSLAAFLQIDLPAILVGVLAALACGLLGNFLVLRRQALIGDAMSHVVLPGIVIGFLVAGEITAPAMMAGAFAAALLAAALIELIRRLGRLEPGAAMGVVFTAMFALGVVLLEQQVGNVHLDVQHALYGELEATLWLGPTAWGDLLDPAVLATAPRQVVTLLAVTLVIALLIGLFFKELQVATFDPGLAASLGLSPRLVSAGLIVLVAAAAVAAFEAVGSILVIAMFICPAATARMLTDRLGAQILLSALAAVAAGVGGYVLAAFGPFWIGGSSSLNAAGMIAVVAGLLQVAAMLLAPCYGVIPQALARRRGRRRPTAPEAVPEP